MAALTRKIISLQQRHLRRWQYRKRIDGMNTIRRTMVLTGVRLTFTITILLLWAFQFATQQRNKCTGVHVECLMSSMVATLDHIRIGCFSMYLLLIYALLSSEHVFLTIAHDFYIFGSRYSTDGEDAPPRTRCTIRKFRHQNDNFCGRRAVKGCPNTSVFLVYGYLKRLTHFAQVQQRSGLLKMSCTI